MIDLAVALALAEKHFPKGPEALAAHMGVAVRYTPLVGCAGWCIRHNGVAAIRISTGVPETRQRFTLAHELAHLLLGSEPEVRPEVDSPTPPNGGENAADQLAAELLLPQSQLRRLVSEPPVESSAIKRLARAAKVSETMAACRITSLARDLGLINAAVVCFDNDAVKWVWSKTLTIPPDLAVALREQATTATRGVRRIGYRPGEVIVASLIGSDRERCLFVQVLPSNIGGKKGTAERIAELDQWLFGQDNSFRGRVNGCLSSFKPHAAGMEVGDALMAFNAKYLVRWTGPAGARIRDPRGQEFLRLRLAQWCHSG